MILEKMAQTEASLEGTAETESPPEGIAQTETSREATGPTGTFPEGEKADAIVATRQAPTAETAMTDIDHELMVTAGTTVTTGIGHAMMVEIMEETEGNADATNRTIVTAAEASVETEKGTDGTTVRDEMKDAIVTDATTTSQVITNVKTTKMIRARRTTRNMTSGKNTTTMTLTRVRM